MPIRERVTQVLPRHRAAPKTLILEAYCSGDQIIVVTAAPGRELDGSPLNWREGLRVLVRIRYPYGDPTFWPAWNFVPRDLRAEIRGILHQGLPPEPCDLIIAERRPPLGLKAAVLRKLTRLTITGNA